MRGYLSQTAEGSVPYIQDLESFYEFINARPPLDKDFDIREIDPEVLKGYDFVTKPFRHNFYCITLFLEGDVTLNGGFWKVRLKNPAIYFKTPCQVVSWQKPERWLREYFIVFTEKFIGEHKFLADVIFSLPFFQLEKAIPFEIEGEEVELLTNLYKQIMKEYKSDNKDKFAVISSYVHILLLHVKRLYFKYVQTDGSLITHIHDHDHLLIQKFRSLIREKIATGEANNGHLKVAHLASLLSTHPNHLNAVVKRRKKKPAIAFMHEQILMEAQSLLNQTEMTIKEIAFRLGFADPSHFNNFFKKQTGSTPAVYRKEKSI